LVLLSILAPIDSSGQPMIICDDLNIIVLI
jgi:hypothetical protein